jgi:hypothetical protein
MNSGRARQIGRWCGVGMNVFAVSGNLFCAVTFGKMTPYLLPASIVFLLFAVIHIHWAREFYES